MKILVKIAFIVTIFSVSSIESIHPHYSFRCLENGEIDLFGLHNESKITIVDKCTNETLKADKFNVLAIPRRCLNTSQENTTTVNIKVFDPTISHIKYPWPVPLLPTRSYEGGPGIQYFTINCKHISDDGVSKTAVRVFQNKIYDVLPENYMEVGSVEMRFKAVNDINFPDINTIYVGDEFFMYIKYKGSQTYSVVPKKCIAFKGTIISAGENQVELWDWSKSPNKCTRAKELLESFSIASPTVIYAKMYGFRFADSNFITIQCEVGVYPDQQKLLCSDDAMNAASKSVDSSRRRREIDDIKIKTKFAFAKLHVFDNKDIYLMENKSGKKAGNTGLWIIICVCVCLSIESI